MKEETLMPHLSRIALAGLLLSVVGLQSQPASGQQDRRATKPLHILMCGHSFHWPIYEHLPEAAASGNHARPVMDQFNLGNSRTINIWEQPDEKNMGKKLLRTGDIDVLTLSPHRKHPDPGIDLFVDLALQNNPHTRITVQQSWLAFDNAQAQRPSTPNDWNAATGESLLALHAPYFKEFEDQIDNVNRKLGKQAVFTVPVSRALIALREKIRLGQAPGLRKQSDLFADDWGHPQWPLVALSTYCHHAVIYRQDPRELPQLPLIKQKAKSRGDELDKLLKELAWDAVTHHPQSGVRAPAK
jgi:hypothetical protein